MKSNFYDKQETVFHQHPLVWAIIIALMTFAATLVVGYISEDMERISCSDFYSHESAQKHFKSDVVKYERLDGDKDLIACEDLLNKK